MKSFKFSTTQVYVNNQYYDLCEFVDEDGTYRFAVTAKQYFDIIIGDDMFDD